MKTKIEDAGYNPLLDTVAVIKKQEIRTKITNNAGLPQPVYEAIVNDEYSRGDSDISVTELIDPPRIRSLKRKHASEIEIEAETLLAITLGKAFHTMIESGTKTGTAERRLSTDVLGWRISGGMDHYHDGVLTDYKTCNKWKTVMSDGGKIPEFEKQLNVYAHILRKNNFEVKQIKIFALFKDWTNPEFKKAENAGKVFIPNKQAGYPAKTWLYFDLPLWPADVAEKYVHERVKIHQQSDEVLALCEASETWSGRRCASYCLVEKYCSQYQQAKKTGLIDGVFKIKKNTE